MKQTEVKLDIHGISFKFFYGTKKELVKEFGLDPEEIKSGGVNFRERRVYITKIPNRGKMDILGTLTHEITHVVDLLSRKRGFANEMEHKAYIAGYFFREASKGLGFK